MGFLNIFRNADQDVIEILVNNLIRENKLNNLEKELLNINPLLLNKLSQESWYFFYAAAAFQRNDRKESFRRIRDAYKKFPESDRINFALGQEYENVTQIDNMVECFKKVTYPQATSRHVMDAARCCYLWNKIEEGKILIESIFIKYEELKILDDMFLHMRHLPFFSEAWGYFALFNYLLGKNEASLKRLDEYSKLFKDYDFDYEIVRLKSLMENDTIKLIQKNISLVYNSNNLIKLENVIFQARSMDYLGAEKLLKQFEFSRNDYPWFKDIKALALAEIAHKFSYVDKEKKYLNIYLEKQPLLLEPHYIYTFQFIDYHESVKALYRKRKTAL